MELARHQAPPLRTVEPGAVVAPYDFVQNNGCGRMARQKVESRLFEIAVVLVRLDQIARFIVNANRSIM